MEIVWDEPKRLKNLRNHGFDFVAIKERFDFRIALIEPSHPGRDGRARFIAVGPLDGNIVTLVFSRLGTEAISIISLRLSSRKERKRYDSA